MYIYDIVVDSILLWLIVYFLGQELNVHGIFCFVCLFSMYYIF
jgi:hypothetical protein